MNTKTIVTGLVALLILIIAGVLFFGGKDEIPSDQQEIMTDGGSLETEASEPFIGREDAPLTVHYWHDFQCPICKRFETETLPTLINEYVEPGEVRIVFRGYPFIGAHSTEAALVAHAVWETHPQSYFLWHQAMFEAQDRENGGFGDRASILELTGAVEGIDIDDVSAALSAHEAAYRAEVDVDRQEGESRGVRSTPSFLIGTQQVHGAQPAAVFRQLINTHLGN